MNDTDLNPLQAKLTRRLRAFDRKLRRKILPQLAGSAPGAADPPDSFVTFSARIRRATAKVCEEEMQQTLAALTVEERLAIADSLLRANIQSTLGAAMQADALKTLAESPHILETLIGLAVPKPECLDPQCPECGAAGDLSRN